MAVDWGLSTALLGRDDFGQYRQDAIQNQMYQQKMADEAAQNYQQEQAAQQGLLDAFNKPSQLDVLPADKQRILDFEQEQRKPIEDAIYKANGDLGQFYANGGNVLLNNYKQGLMTAKDDRGLNPIAAALHNKQINAMYENAQQNGLDIAPVVDPKTGMEIPFSQQLTEHGANKRDLLQWNGSAKKVDYLPALKYLSGEYNPNGDKYSPYNYSPAELKTVLGAVGGTPWQQSQALKQLTLPNGQTVVSSKYDKPDRTKASDAMGWLEYNYMKKYGTKMPTYKEGNAGGSGSTPAENFIAKSNLLLNKAPGMFTPLPGHAAFHSNKINGTPVEVDDPISQKKIIAKIKDVTYDPADPDNYKIWYKVETKKGKAPEDKFITVNKSSYWSNIVEPYSRNAKYGTKFGTSLYDAAVNQNIVDGSGQEKWELPQTTTTAIPQAQPQSTSTGRVDIKGF